MQLVVFQPIVPRSPRSYSRRMRYILESIEARKLPAEIERRGISPRQLVRVEVEILGAEVPLARLAEGGRAFDFLADEPDLYTEADIKR